MTNNAKQLRVTILCEDIAHHRFIRRYLECRGVPRRHISDFGNLKGRNNASVLKDYPALVETYRRKANFQQNLAVVVMMDADEQTLAEKMRWFDKAVDEEKARLNQQTRGQDEKIAIFLPARNIETWFRYVDGHPDCDERTDYKRFYSNDFAELAAEKLATEICPRGLPKAAPVSLHQACLELRRLGLD
jgi:hypothetical protein